MHRKSENGIAGLSAFYTPFNLSFAVSEYGGANCTFPKENIHIYT